MILAGRYGSEDIDEVGFTEKEFDYARTHSIPILVFCCSNIDSLPACKCEKTDTGCEKLKKFREKVLSGTMASLYTSVDDLKAKIATSINKAKIDTPREGWIRASWTDSPQTASEKIVAELSEELKVLKAEVASQPKIHVGTEPPETVKNGDLFLQIE